MQQSNRKNSVMFTNTVFASLCLGIFCSAQVINIGSAKPGSTAVLAAKSETPTSQAATEVPFDRDLYNKDKSVAFASAELLYWLVNEGALDYAVKMNEPAWSTTQNTYAIGNYKNAEFDWSPGFRISIGFFNAPKYWDVFALYTYLPTSGSNTTYAPKAAAQFLNGTWIQPDLNSGAPPAPLQKARSYIDMKYNVLDLIFSRRFHTNEHLRVNVFGGVTSAFIYQKWKVIYEDINALQSSIRNRWQFEGLGIRLGVKIDWFLGWDFYLTGQASTAILSGWYENSARQKTSATFANADNSLPIRDTHFHDSRLTYTAQFSAGPSWQKTFDCCRAEVLAGYEFTVWTNLHEIYRSSFAAPTAAKETFINNSNVSLQGLRVRVNVDF